MWEGNRKSSHGQDELVHGGVTLQFTVQTRALSRVTGDALISCCRDDKRNAELSGLSETKCHVSALWLFQSFNTPYSQDVTALSSGTPLTMSSQC